MIRNNTHYVPMGTVNNDYSSALKTAPQNNFTKDFKYTFATKLKFGDTKRKRPHLTQ